MKRTMAVVRAALEAKEMAMTPVLDEELAVVMAVNELQSWECEDGPS